MFVSAILARLFPPACCGCGVAGAALCAACRPRVDAGHRLSVAALRVRAAGRYTGPLRRTILAYKRGRRDAGDVLADLLADRIGPGFPAQTVLVPVPTTSPRRRARGFDQGVLLAQGLGARLEVPVIVALGRRAGGAQHGRSRSARLAATGRFVCIAPQLVAGARLVLVDDVVTTGATLRDCAEVLQECGATVREAVVLAYA
jgi:ComF family protein